MLHAGLVSVVPITMKHCTGHSSSLAPSFASSIHPGDRPQRRERLRGSRPTGWCCSFSRKPSRRRWASLCSRTRSACTTPPCTPCRTCSPGQKTIRWPPSPPWHLSCECVSVCAEKREGERQREGQSCEWSVFISVSPEWTREASCLTFKNAAP